MNKKFIIVSSGEEITYGDLIRCAQKRETSFGVFTRYSEFRLSPLNVERLLKIGAIKRKEEVIEDVESLDIYLTLVSQQLKCSIEELSNWLERLNKVCPKAVLDFLLQAISTKFYNDDPEGFNAAEIFYSLRPKDGKVGKVLNNPTYIPLFKSVEDAEKARKILKKQLTFMYGEQKDC